MSETPKCDPFEGPPATFRDFLTGAARRFANRTALIELHGEDRRSMSYRQLRAEAERIGAHLGQLGIRKSDCVAVLSENRIEWVVFALAAMSIGAVLVPLDTNLTTEELSALIERAKLRLLAVSRQYLDAGIRAADGTVQILCFDPTCASDGLLDWSYLQLAEAAAVGDGGIDPDAPALIVFTSGTTSSPKGVVLTHRNVLSSAWWCSQHTGMFHPTPRMFFAIPLFHMFTFTAGLIAPLLTAGTCLIGSSLKPIPFQTEICASKPTLMIGVPLIFESILQSIRAGVGGKPRSLRWLIKAFGAATALGGPRAWRSLSRWLYRQVHRRFGGGLEFLVSGGAPLAPEVSRDLERIGFIVAQGYGLTEAGPIISSEGASFSRLGSVGRVLSHLEVRILDSNAEGVGEILVRGDAVMPGYYGMPSLNREAFVGGWFKTGDLGRIDRDGFLFIQGRNKDLIVTPGGKKIYPEDLERFYLQSPWIKEICISERMGPGGHAGLAATIVPQLDDHPGRSDSEVREALDLELQRLGHQLPLYKRIAEFVISDDELTKTTLKKLKRNQIHAAFAARASSPGHPGGDSGKESTP